MALWVFKAMHCMHSIAFLPVFVVKSVVDAFFVGLDDFLLGFPMGIFTAML